MRQAAVKTKKELNSLLVAERKSMREKQKQSAFMRKSLSVYSAMKRRAEECKENLDFDLAIFREFVLAEPCCRYCGKTLNERNWTVDHRTPIVRGGEFCLRNLIKSCQPCNWQKGSLTVNEFSDLVLAIGEMEPAARTDIRRRLTIGGKWGVRA